jgi:hypothetical protein
MRVLHMCLVYAGFDHPQGQGNVVLYSKCKAKLDVYIPKNTTRFPYICIVARNNHSHHPPYPTRLPKDIAQDVVNVLQDGEVLGMTGRMSSILAQYARRMLTLY